MALNDLISALRNNAERIKARRDESSQSMLQAAAQARVQNSLSAESTGDAEFIRPSNPGKPAQMNPNFKPGDWPAVGERTKHGGYSWSKWAGDINVPGSGDYGNPVSAYKKGKVTAVNSWNNSYGKHVKIKHPDGTSTLYAHLSGMRVKPGQRVKSGQVIGKVGSTGNSSGPHLHFEII